MLRKRESGTMPAGLPVLIVDQYSETDLEPSRKQALRVPELAAPKHGGASAPKPRRRPLVRCTDFVIVSPDIRYRYYGGSAANANNASPASSRLSATALWRSRHLRMNALRRSAMSCGVAA